jgi:PST family polysaccharide transporter
LSRVFLQVSESVALTLSPAMVLVILCVPVAVPKVFGDAWSGAIVPFQLLAAMTIPCMLVSLMGPLTIAVGRADWEFRWALGTTIAGVVAFLIGLQWGIIGVAAAYLVVVAAQLPVRLIIIGRLTPIRAGDYYRSILPAAVASLALAISWIAADVMLQSSISGMVLLTVASVISLGVYVILLLIGWPTVSRRQIDFFGSVLRRQSSNTGGMAESSQRVSRQDDLDGRPA